MKSLIIALLFMLRVVASNAQVIPPLYVPYIPPYQPAPIDYNAINNRIAMDEANRRDAIASCALRNKSIYSSSKSYPSSLPDGWYKISATNEINMCGERIVFVQDNRIKRWFVAGIHERIVSVSSLIEKGFATVKGADGEFISCYFIDNILDPSAHVAEPQFGAVSFYTNNAKLRGTIKIDIEGQYSGEIEGYFLNQVPSCNEKYTLTVLRKPGVYSFTAQNDRMTWNGTVEVKNGSCLPFLLSVKK